VKQTSLAIGWADGVYVTASQWERFADGARWLVVRTARDAEALAPTIRRVISSVDKDQPVLHVATMEERVRGSLVERRFALVLFEAFALVALVLAAIGVYGLLSGGVNERTRELGVRAALGASRATILSLVLRQGMALVGLGLIVGGAGAFIASQALAKLLFGTSPLDASAYLVVVLLFVAVSLLACGLPAWRAARISPSIALRA
jgi:ABC-type antimicrobial peptide transport system permease subunit